MTSLNSDTLNHQESASSQDGISSTSLSPCTWKPIPSPQTTSIFSKICNLDFNIDNYLNRFIPLNRVSRLPKPISWFLGYRERPQKQIGAVLGWFFAFIGAFVGLLVAESVFMTSYFQREGTPIVIASLGAAAILQYNVINSPLAQPRPAILSQLIASVVGVSITKLFLLAGPTRFQSLKFIAGALSVALTSSLMSITNTVHPPAGATALLCSTTPDIMALGWEFVGLAVLGSCLMVAVGCVVNNLRGEAWPLYWWTGEDLRSLYIAGRDVGMAGEGEGEGKGEGKGEGEGYRVEYERAEERIMVDGNGIVAPPWVELGEEERRCLETLRKRMRRGERWGSVASGGTWETRVCRADGVEGIAK